MADTNLIKKSDLARVREIEFTEMFGDSIKKLMEALGVTRKIAKQAGTTLKTYKASGTLESGAVAEGDTIPMSKYKTEAVTYKEITRRPGVKFCVSDFRQKSRMALESRADSGLNPLITESHGGQNGMRAGTA